MGYDWKVAYWDDEKLVLRQVRDKRLAPMIVFEFAHMHGWKVGDSIDTTGEPHPHREMQKKMEMPLIEDDYILTNQRTGVKANTRKNDFEIEDAGSG